MEQGEWNKLLLCQEKTRGTSVPSSERKERDGGCRGTRVCLVLVPEEMPACPLVQQSVGLCPSFRVGRPARGRVNVRPRSPYRHWDSTSGPLALKRCFLPSINHYHSTIGGSGKGWTVRTELRGEDTSVPLAKVKLNNPNDGRYSLWTRPARSSWAPSAPARPPPLEALLPSSLHLFSPSSLSQLQRCGLVLHALLPDPGPFPLNFGRAQGPREQSLLCPRGPQLRFVTLTHRASLHSLPYSCISLI